jgi:hypothetical protein
MGEVGLRLRRPWESLIDRPLLLWESKAWESIRWESFLRRVTMVGVKTAETLGRDVGIDRRGNRSNALDSHRIVIVCFTACIDSPSTFTGSYQQEH